ncbi:MAG: alcohol dehydrogenase catalytic domain-containing protein [Pseudonocardiaceae bacterium]|nr:alcohol dehydrogenase catalytic domain-containing protein [Pseudonocardiaceae bacterium]
MQAVVVHAVDDLRVDELPDPQCGPGEVAVEVCYGGVCGSDLHYWQHGHAGTSILREPMVLGHEVSGRIAAIGTGVSDLPVGTPATVHPATTCRDCPECARGDLHLCRNVRYLGSAAHYPHTPGAFSRYRVVPADQIRVLPPAVPLHHGAVAEPLAVALHAVARAGSDAMRDANVLVNGAGPIGCLTVAAAKAAGAARVVAADLLPEAVQVATALGADATVIIGREELPSEMDVVFEASGAPAALAASLGAVRRGGTFVQLGMLPPGEITAPLGISVACELTIRGAYRFDTEFDDALGLLAGGLNVEPLLTQTMPADDALAAFDVARDRRRSSKVLLSFG